MNQSDSDSDSEEQDEEKQRKLKEREKLIIQTFYPPLNLRRAGDVDRKLLLRRTREVLSVTHKLKTDQNREGNSNENAPGPSDAAAETREDISPLLPIIVPKRMVNLTMQFEYEEESEQTNDEEADTQSVVQGRTQSGTKSGPSGIIDSSFPTKKTKKTKPIEDLQVLKKVAEMQSVIGGGKGVMKFGEKSGKTDDVNLREPAIIHTKKKKSKEVQAIPAETKDEKTYIPQTFIKTKSQDLSAEKIQTKRREWKKGDKLKEAKHEKSDTVQKPVKSDKIDLTEPAEIHTKETESRKSDEKQTIEIQSKVVSVTKIVQPISTKIKAEKTDIPQTFVKTESQDIRAEKIKTEWNEPKKDDEKRDSTIEKVTIIKKIEIKNGKLSLPEETSTKKDTLEPDTKSIKPETVPLKKEEKIKKYDETPIVKKYDKKLNTPQQTIKTERKEISITKKGQPISTETKFEKTDIPQTFVKTGSQDLRAEKIQTNWKGPKKDEKLDPTTEKVTIIKKIQIKNEKTTLQEKSAKKDTSQPDTKSIKSHILPIKKEDKIITPIKTKAVVKPLQVVKTIHKSKVVEETSMTNLDLLIKPIELVVLVTSTMETLMSCLLLAEKINYRTKGACKCRKNKEMWTEKGKTKNGSTRHTSGGGGRTFYSKISYADKAIQHVMYVIIYARFPNINFFQMEEIKIK